MERELEESGAAEEGDAVKVEVLEAGPDKTAGGILVSMAKAGASPLVRSSFPVCSWYQVFSGVWISK